MIITLGQWHALQLQLINSNGVSRPFGRMYIPLPFFKTEDDETIEKQFVVDGSACAVGCL